jgi:DNA polymerase (family 10)
LNISNKDVAEHLTLIAQLTALDGGNKFQIGAFADAAKTVRDIGVSVVKLHRDQALSSLPGIGESIQAVIAELIETGNSKRLQDLGTRWPIEAMTMTRTTGIGPKIAMKFHAEGVNNFDELVQLANSSNHKLKPRMVQEILAAERKKDTGRVPHGTAVAVSDFVVEQLRPLLLAVDVCGSIRRGTPDSKDIDIVAVPNTKISVKEIFEKFTELGEVISLGENRSSIRVEKFGVIMQCDLWLVDQDQIGSAKVYAKGSKDHCVALRTRAKNRGWTLNEYGLFKGDYPGGIRLGGTTEQEVYGLLGLPYYEPKNRTGDLTYDHAED